MGPRAAPRRSLLLLLFCAARGCSAVSVHAAVCGPGRRENTVECVAENGVIFMLGFWLLSLATELVLCFVLGDWFQLMPIRRKRNIVCYYMQILVTVQVNFIVIIFGWRLLFLGDALHPGEARACWGGAVTMVLALHVWELIYRVELNVSLLMHHLLTLIMFLLLCMGSYSLESTGLEWGTQAISASVEATQLQLQGQLVDAQAASGRALALQKEAHHVEDFVTALWRTAFLFCLMATTEQVSYIALLKHRSGSTNTASWFFAAAMNQFFFKSVLLIGHIVNYIVVWMSADSRGTLTGLAWYHTFQVLGLIMPLGLFGTQIYCGKVLLVLSRRQRELQKSKPVLQEKFLVKLEVIKEQPRERLGLMVIDDYVNSVEIGSPAERGGLRPGMHLVKINNTVVDGSISHEIVAILSTGATKFEFLVENEPLRETIELLMCAFEEGCQRVCFRTWMRWWRQRAGLAPTSPQHNAGSPKKGFPQLATCGCGDNVCLTASATSVDGADEISIGTTGQVIEVDKEPGTGNTVYIVSFPPVQAGRPWSKARVPAAHVIPIGADGNSPFGERAVTRVDVSPEPSEGSLSPTAAGARPQRRLCGKQGSLAPERAYTRVHTSKGVRPGKGVVAISGKPMDLDTMLRVPTQAGAGRYSPRPLEGTASMGQGSSGATGTSSAALVTPLVEAPNSHAITVTEQSHAISGPQAQNSGIPGPQAQNSAGTVTAWNPTFSRFPTCMPRSGSQFGSVFMQRLETNSLRTKTFAEQHASRVGTGSRSGTGSAAGRNRSFDVERALTGADVGIFTRNESRFGGMAMYT